MADPRYGKCGDCAAWFEVADDRGQCRRHPPAPMPGGTSAFPWPEYPKPAALWGCFDFIPKEDRPHG